MADAPKFEESLAQLEKLVDELEGGELDLDEALKRFEKGVKLSAALNFSLEEANRKVEKLIISSSGEASREPLDEDEKSPEKKSAPKKTKGSQDTLF